MKLTEVIQTLEHHNRWRRDENVPATTAMVEPKVLGVAIDRAVEELKKLKNHKK